MPVDFGQLMKAIAQDDKFWRNPGPDRMVEKEAEPMEALFGIQLRWAPSPSGNEVNALKRVIAERPTAQLADNLTEMAAMLFVARAGRKQVRRRIATATLLIGLELQRREGLSPKTF